MASIKENQWVRTLAALEVFMENFSCKKCKKMALEPIRYLKCDHLFCTSCIGSKSQCPKCQTPAERNEVRPDVIIPQLITHGNTISQIIKQSSSPLRREDETHGLNSSVQDPDSSQKARNSYKSINKPNQKGETKLHKACIKPDIDAVRCLLEAGANPNTKDNSSWSPLQEAISYGFYEIAKLLLEAGAFPDTPGSENRTPLHTAVIHGEIKQVQLLRQYNVETNARDCYGKTPLDYAESDEMREALTEENKPSESVLEKTFISTTNSMHPLNNSFTRNKTIVFGSNLSSESRSLLSQMAKQHKLKIAKTYSSAVTHVVVETNYLCFTPVSYEILLAILHGKWILNKEWIDYCIQLADLNTMDLTWCEVLGTTGAPGDKVPSKARDVALKQHPRLFNGCSFFFAMNNSSKYQLGDLEFTKSSLSHLVTEGEGKVLNRKPDPETTQEFKEIPFHVANKPEHPLHSQSVHRVWFPCLPFENKKRIRTRCGFFL